MRGHWKMRRRHCGGEGGEPQVFQMRIDPTWHERVTQAAESLGTTLSEYIRLAVDEKIKRDAPVAEAARLRGMSIVEYKQFAAEQLAQQDLKRDSGPKE
jgi:hypothetical protein